MKNRFIATILILIGSVATSLASDTYKFDSERSTIAFSIHQYFQNITGNFKRFSGTITVNPEQPEKSSVTAKIDVASIDTGIAKRDAHLRSADLFNVAKFPEITFRSRNVKRTGDTTADVSGDLTMHGVTKSIVLHVSFEGDAKAAASAQRTNWQVITAPLNRREFGLLFSGGAEAISGIGQGVTAKIDIEAERQ